MTIAGEVLGFEGAVNITPSDTNDVFGHTANAGQTNPPHVRALFVGGTGNITAITANGQTILISAIPVGAIIQIAVQQIKATATTATLIVGLY